MCTYYTIILHSRRSWFSHCAIRQLNNKTEQQRQPTVRDFLRPAILLRILHRHEQHIIIQTPYLYAVLSPKQQLPTSLRSSGKLRSVYW
jgi:hypothetical protein